MQKTTKPPKVSIVSIAYNQEKYIAEMLDSLVSQQTDFEFEIVIADDCSTDTTQQIIEKYARTHPTIVKPILRTKNIGVQANLKNALQTAKGQYIALCEGDDYWTDPGKLQQQASFMDDNPDYGLCFHPVKVFFENSEEKDYIYPDPQQKIEFSLENLLRNNFIQTNSVMYRRQTYNHIPTNILPMDWYLHLYHAQFGKIGFTNKTMAAYRRHPGGVWWGSQTDSYDLWKKHGLAHILVFVEMLKLLGKEEAYKKIIIQHVCQVLDRLVEVDKKYESGLLKKAIVEFPDDVEGIIVAQHEASKDVQEKLQAHMNEQGKIIEHLGNERDNLKRQYENSMKELNRVNTELGLIKDSPTWRAIRKLSKARRSK